MKASFETGDVYLVKFHPSSGAEFKKYRPAVIISSKVSTIDARFTLIIPLTSNTKKYNAKYEVLIKKNDFLKQDSVALPWYLWTVDTERLTYKLGQLHSSEIKKIKKVLAELF